MPAQAGIQKQELDPRFRGGERSIDAALPRPPVPLELFREVRSPERNFGPARLSGGITVTPLARRLAGENGIDLGDVKGSGPRGRIVARDVEQAIDGARTTGVREPSAAAIMALYRDTPFTEVPLDGMRRTIAARLTQAVQTIPHFTLSADAEIDALQTAREQMNEAAPKQNGEPAYKISLNDFIIKALALALQRVPQANAVWAGDRILRFTHSDIGVAVAVADGLFTPVLRRAETKSLGAISAEMRDLSARARDKALRPEAYQGGATSISNLGMHGVREFSAIINPPQASILAVGAARRAPVEMQDGGIRFVTAMTLTLSCDHRAMDGVTGAALLASVKGFLERPVTMLV